MASLNQLPKFPFSPDVAERIAEQITQGKVLAAISIEAQTYLPDKVFVSTMTFYPKPNKRKDYPDVPVIGANHYTYSFKSTAKKMKLTRIIWIKKGNGIAPGVNDMYFPSLANFLSVHQELSHDLAEAAVGTMEDDYSKNPR